MTAKEGLSNNLHYLDLGVEVGVHRVNLPLPCSLVDVTSLGPAGGLPLVLWFLGLRFGALRDLLFISVLLGATVLAGFISGESIGLHHVNEVLVEWHWGAGT